MYPETFITRRRRPRRTLDHLFGDDEIVLPPGVTPFNPDAGILRPRTIQPPVAVVEPTEQPVPGSLTRPRRVNPETVEDLNVPFGSSGEPFGSTRPRRTQPRDYIADDAQYLRDTQNAPVEGSRLKSAAAGFQRGGIIGGIIGAARPEMYGEMKRDREAGRVRERIGGEVALQGAQRQMRRMPLEEDLLRSQIDENEAQAAARMRPPRPILGSEVMEDGTKIQTEFNPETGIFEPSIRDGRPITLSRPKAPEPMVEVRLSDGTKGTVPFTEALRADATRTGRIERAETKADEREGQKLSAQDEFDQLTADEVAAGDEKNRAYAYLEQLKANPNVTQDDINEAQKAAEAANVFYRSFGPKKTAAKAKISRYSVSTRPDRPARPAEDPNVRRYANEFFHGDYGAADAAIKRQRGGQ